MITDLSEIKAFNSGYDLGRTKILDYILERGESILQSREINNDLAMGVCLIMGIAQAEKEKIIQFDEVKQTKDKSFIKYLRDNKYCLLDTNGDYWEVDEVLERALNENQE